MAIQQLPLSITNLSCWLLWPKLALLPCDPQRALACRHLIRPSPLDRWDSEWLALAALHLFYHHPHMPQAGFQRDTFADARIHTYV